MGGEEGIVLMSICCNGKRGQLVSVQSKQGKKQQAPTAAGKVKV